MKRPIAVIDYSVDGKSGLLIKSWLNKPVKIISVKDNLLFPEVDINSFSAIIHSGSSHSIVSLTSFIEDAKLLVNNSIKEKKPQMGICYGHQLLALATVGEISVARCSQIEIGWQKINFLPSWPSDKIIGSHYVWESHYDCVLDVPENSQIIASNKHTKIQAFINKDLRLFGTQFHPEFNLEDGNKAYIDDKETFEKNNVNLENALVSKLEPVPGSFVFSDFLKLYEVE